MGIDNSGQYEFALRIDNLVGVICNCIFGGAKYLPRLDNHGFLFNAAAADDHPVSNNYVRLLFFHRIHSTKYRNGGAVLTAAPFYILILGILLHCKGPKFLDKRNQLEKDTQRRHPKEEC